MMSTTNERCIKLVLAYDGSDFSGWQRQQDRRSVQGELEQALEKMHGHPVGLTAAGRTDTGVHATGQVAHFHTDIRGIPAEKFRVALNKLCSADVRVVQAVQEHPDFHARYDARYRRYKYFLRYDGPPLPHLDRYAWRLQHRPDVRRLNRLAACLKGEIDCSAFATAKDPHEHRHRYLHHAVFYMEHGALVFDVCANAFLWHMVRSLVGTLIELDRSGAQPAALRDILHSADRRLAGVTAPAHGLFLWEVAYYRRPTRTGRYRPAQLVTEGDSRRMVPGLGLV